MKTYLTEEQEIEIAKNGTFEQKIDLIKQGKCLEILIHDESEIIRNITFFETHTRPTETFIPQKIKFNKLNDKAIIPQYQTRGSAGADVHFNNVGGEFVHSVILKPLERILIGTGLTCEFTNDYVLDVRPRSGLAYKHGITVLNAPGTIDSDYKSEIGVILVNLSNENVEIKNGDRIAQLVLLKVEVDYSLVIDAERDGGFGSSGK